MLIPTPTLKELRDALNTLSDEQLAEPCRWWGEERAGKIRCLNVLDEEYLRDDEAVYPRSETQNFDPEELEGMEVLYQSGTPIMDEEYWEDNAATN